MLATGDGVFASFAGGEQGTWSRTGERLRGRGILSVIPTQEAMTWLALSDEAIWVTMDGGVNWQRYYIMGGRESPVAMISFHGDIQHLWLLTSNQAYRMGTLHF